MLVLWNDWPNMWSKPFSPAIIHGTPTLKFYFFCLHSLLILTNLLLLKITNIKFNADLSPPIQVEFHFKQFWTLFAKLEWHDKVTNSIESTLGFSNFFFISNNPVCSSSAPRRNEFSPETGHLTMDKACMTVYPLALDPVCNINCKFLSHRL